MGFDKVREIKTNQGTIKVQYNNEKSSFDYKETNDGYLHVKAKDVSLFLPENSASKVVTGGGNSIFNKMAGGFYGNSENLKIIDGAENNGKRYSDEIQILGDNITYEAAKKTVDGKNFYARNADKGDVILVAEGKGNKVEARSGNKVLIDKDAENTKVKTSQGGEIADRGENTKITVEKAPDTKGSDPKAGVDVTESNKSTTVVVDKGTFTKVTGNATVKNKAGKDITKTNSDDSETSYYKQ